jgi:hypothetical protein
VRKEAAQQGIWGISPPGCGDGEGQRAQIRGHITGLAFLVVLEGLGLHGRAVSRRWRRRQQAGAIEESKGDARRDARVRERWGSRELGNRSGRLGGRLD